MNETPPEMKQPQSEKDFSAADGIRTLPSGWDLSSLPTPPPPTINGSTEPAPPAQEAPTSEQEARERTEWQLDPYFDRTYAPSRRDLSAY